MRIPSKHELRSQVNPGKAVFVQDPPEGSTAEQSPIVSAFRSSSDALQFATRRLHGIKCVDSTGIEQLYSKHIRKWGLTLVMVMAKEQQQK